MNILWCKLNKKNETKKMKINFIVKHFLQKILVHDGLSSRKILIHVEKYWYMKVVSGLRTIPRPWTDKEKSVFDRAHYEIHHDAHDNDTAAAPTIELEDIWCVPAPTPASPPPATTSSDHSIRSTKFVSYTDLFIMKSPPTIHGHHRQ